MWQDDAGALMVEASHKFPVIGAMQWMCMSDVLSRYVRCPRQCQYGANPNQSGQGYIMCPSYQTAPLSCPVCLERYLWHNLMQEELYSCAYRSEGCPVYLPLKYIFIHQLSCQFSTYFCNVEVNGVRCSFIGTLQLLRIHLWSHHANVIYIQNRRSFVFYQLADLSPWTQWHGIIRAYSDFFICVFKAYQREIIGYTMLLGPANRSTQYIQETTFMNLDQTERISFQRAVLSVHFDEPYIFRSGAFFHVTFDSVERLMTQQKSLPFKLKIKKSGFNSLPIATPSSASCEPQNPVSSSNVQTSEPNAPSRHTFKSRSAVQNRPPCYGRPGSTAFESTRPASTSNEWTRQTRCFGRSFNERKTEAPHRSEPQLNTPNTNTLDAKSGVCTEVPHSTAQKNHCPATTQHAYASGSSNIAWPVKEHNEFSEEQCSETLPGAVESAESNHPDQNIVQKSPTYSSTLRSQIGKKKGRKGRTSLLIHAHNSGRSEDAASEIINSPEMSVESVVLGKKGHPVDKQAITKAAEESILQSKSTSKSEVDAIAKQKHLLSVFTRSEVGEDNANKTPIAVSDMTSSSRDKTSKRISKCVYKPKAEISPFGLGFMSMPEIHEGNEYFSECHDTPDLSAKCSSCDQVYEEARAIHPEDDPYFTQVARYDYFNPPSTMEARYPFQKQEQIPSLLSWIDFEPQTNKKVSPSEKVESIYKSKLPNRKTGFPSVERAGFSEMSSEKFCETHFPNRSTSDETSIFEPYPLLTLESDISNGQGHSSTCAMLEEMDADINKESERYSSLLSSLSESFDLLSMSRSVMPTGPNMDNKSSEIRLENNDIEEARINGNFDERNTRDMEFKNSFPDTKSPPVSRQGNSDKSKNVVNAKSKNVANGKSKNVANDKSKNVANGKSKNVANGKSKNVANGKSKNVANDKSKNVANDKSKNVANDKSKNVVNEKSENVANDKSKNEANDKSKNVANDKSKNVANDKSKNVANDKSKNVANDKSKNVVNDEARAANQGKQTQNTEDPGKGKKQGYSRKKNKRSGNPNPDIVYYYKQL